MASIGDAILDMISRIKLINFPNNDGASVPLYSVIWNNQFDKVVAGETYPFQLPCALVELINGAGGDIGQGVSGWDITFRLHIGMNELDAGQGDIDQNTTIFTLRNLLLDVLTYQQPVGCGELVCVSENQDFNHSNFYAYILDFKCHFVETAADQNQKFIASTPPTDLEVDATVIKTETQPDPDLTYWKIPQTWTI